MKTSIRKVIKIGNSNGITVDKNLNPGDYVKIKIKKILSGVNK